VKKKLIPISIILSVVFTFSACGLTAEEKEVYKNMPDITFVLSFNYPWYNIMGMYITKNGDIKLYDFRKESLYETYDIRDVFDRIERAEVRKIHEIYKPYTKDELARSGSRLTLYERGKLFKAPPPLSKSESINLYETLLSLGKEDEAVRYSLDSLIGADTDWDGSTYIYGIKLNENGETEFFHISSMTVIGGIEFFVGESDEARELHKHLRDDVFGFPLSYTGGTWALLYMF